MFGLSYTQWLTPYKTEAWPTFTVELPSGGVLLVVYRTESMVRAWPALGGVAWHRRRRVAEPVGGGAPAVAADAFHG
ncbi:hypothetical protein Acsp01_33450 [Actinoplanes sp. NBRC 101535]|nr:hypothetical protein Acsp01_33450 [Actinoplanes sp. NBRC 101535]